jgi:hypothetical protein
LEYIYELSRVPVNTILDMKERPCNCTTVTLISEGFNVINAGLNSITKLDMFSSGYRQCKKQLN